MGQEEANNHSRSRERERAPVSTTTTITDLSQTNHHTRSAHPRNRATARRQDRAARPQSRGGRLPSPSPRAPLPRAGAMRPRGGDPAVALCRHPRRRNGPGARPWPAITRRQRVPTDATVGLRAAALALERCGPTETQGQSAAPRSCSAVIRVAGTARARGCRRSSRRQRADRRAGWAARATGGRPRRRPRRSAGSCRRTP